MHREIRSMDWAGNDDLAGEGVGRDPELSWGQ